MGNYNNSHLLDQRREGKITASLGAAIMGIDPYISRQEAWRRITGKAEKKPPNEHQQRGMDNEVYALQSFEAGQGLLLKPGRFILHPEIPWLGASPDSITKDGCPVEVKCPVCLHNALPAHYNIQIQIQIQCLNAPHGWFHSWTEQEPDGFTLKVERENKYFWEKIYTELHWFYHEYVLKDIQPPRRKANSQEK